MVWLPPGRVLVLKVAIPLPLRVPVPIVLPPARKSTVPVGVPGTGLVTVAVKVTACPNTEGLAEEARMVLVVAGVTVWLVLPLLVLKLSSPL